MMLGRVVMMLRVAPDEDVRSQPNELPGVLQRSGHQPWTEQDDVFKEGVRFRGVLGGVFSHGGQFLIRQRGTFANF